MCEILGPWSLKGFMICIIPETMSYKSGSVSLTNPCFSSYMYLKNKQTKTWLKTPAQIFYKAHFLSFILFCNSYLHVRTLPALFWKVHWQSRQAVVLVTLDLAVGCSHGINPNSLFRLLFIFPEITFPSVALHLQ